MFELGMRLAFDKATIIIKDDETPYSFDTGVVEHLEYPRTLRFSGIVEFKEELSRKVAETYRASRSANYSTFLKNFGEFTTPSLSETVVLPEQKILEIVNGIQQDVALMRMGVPSNANRSHRVHSRAVPELNTAITLAEAMHGKRFWAKAEGMTRLIDYLDNESECSSYWPSREAFLQELSHILRDMNRNKSILTDHL